MPGPSAGLHILLLAAGNASRYGSAKQRVLITGISMVRRAALAALATGAGLIVVTGAHAEAVAEELAGLPVTLLHNTHWPQGMGGSIASGFRYLLQTAASSAAAIVCLADQPLIGHAELQRLIAAHRNAPDRIIAADHGAALGPPCLFPSHYYAELAKLSGAQGARKVLERYPAEVDTVAMPQAAVDIDTPDDYERLVSGNTVSSG
jgi:CTP:molybdopterin cytidylyltransferase MocA